jgi:capsule biosynthesis phosphatase
MNIIIPIGGIGKRFKNDGYCQPKPLIKALGRPIIFWVIDNLDITTEDNIFIIYRAEFIQYGFVDILISEFPDKKIIHIPLFHDTKGTSETVKEILISLEMKEHMNKPVLIVDSDSFSEDKIVYHSRKEPKNIIYCYTDNNPEPKFSYVKTHNNYVSEIKEKVKISDRICIGSYAFSSANFLLKIILDMEKENIILKYSNEFYVSSIYAYILEKKLAPIYYIDVNSFHCLGTPVQLQDFCNLKKCQHKYRFCFDLDNTLVTSPTIDKDYLTVKPIEKNIQIIRLLKQQGHTIIIYTARNMRTQNGNIGAVIAKIGQTIFKNLVDFNIPYDELHMGKPYAHFYIDDLTINANDDLEKALGFYNIHPPIRNHHQKINFTETIVSKYSNNIEGEIWWYRNIPKNISFLFPKLYNANNTELSIERIRGIPLSYMLINKTLTTKHIEKLINTIRIIHNSKPNTEQPFVDIRNIYSLKMSSRTTNIIFKEFTDFDIVYNKIMDKLLYYEQKAENNVVIHGDPVLTNILYDLDNNFKFIDMRGKVGETLSILGDPNYDWSKLYQSLCGYEYILLEREPNIQYLKLLRDAFESQFEQKHIEIFRVITASLFLTLIPLHPSIKAKKYYELVKTCL